MEPFVEPLAVPEPIQGIVKSDVNRLAVSTLDGGTLCINRDWMAEISDANADGRFLSFAWTGYEAFGHIVVDRAGAGTVIDTGNKPAFSPGRKRIAGLEASESGWGGLGGFAIWQVTPKGLMPLVSQTAGADDVLPEFFWQEMWDWRIERWVGDDCLEISAVSSAASDAVGGYIDRANRTEYHANRADGWAIKAGPPPAACRQA
jgi:hypothetical protein